MDDNQHRYLDQRQPELDKPGPSESVSIPMRK
jgi:hypothetical protein